MTRRLPASHLVLLFCSLALTLVAPLTARAQELTYLREMPPASRVLADYNDADPMKARAQQIAAFTTLYDVVKRLAGPRGSTERFPNDRERPILDAYRKEAGQLREEALATFGGQTGMDSPRGRWGRSEMAMEQSEQFKQQLLARYFSPEVRRLHRGAEADYQALVDQGHRMIEQGGRELSGSGGGTWDA